MTARQRGAKYGLEEEPKTDDFVKKAGCCVALHPSSLRRTPKYASFLMIRAPCLRTFYEAVPFSRLLRLFYETIKTR